MGPERSQSYIVYRHAENPCKLHHAQGNAIALSMLKSSMTDTVSSEPFHKHSKALH